MPKSLLLLILLASAGALAAPPRASELFLAGGALRTCSDLAPGACRTPPDDPARRMPARYRVDDEAIARALDAQLWQASVGAPARARLSRMLAGAKRAGDWSQRELEDHLADSDTWQRLLDDERAALLSALELPQLHEGRRRIERARLDDSIEQAGVEVLRAFVAAAAERAEGRPPRIAVVTASAIDPFDPVDFYLDAFRQLGADVAWWPVDAALRTAIFDGGDCEALESLRRRHLQLAGRDRVYPDLAETQRQACLDAAGTAALPANVQGIFFAGGDQWRHRQAFFDRDDKPNAWLLALREAHASGDLVVGGTSAGTAVQGGGAMLSNGTSALALREGALARPPMAFGCTRARRCAEDRHEDSLTYWAGGGLGLLPGWTMDTHFSERARELRLLVLMHAARVDFALGVDETSAVRVSRIDGQLNFEAIGAQGGWLFERLPADGSGALEARVHYLAPGAVSRLDAQGLSLHAPAAAGSRSAVAGGDDAASDALAPGALRQAARRAGGCGQFATTLEAGDGRASLTCTPGTFYWLAPDATGAGAGKHGVGNLRLRYEPGRDP